MNELRDQIAELLRELAEDENTAAMDAIYRPMADAIMSTIKEQGLELKKSKKKRGQDEWADDRH